MILSMELWLNKNIIEKFHHDKQHCEDETDISIEDNFPVFKVARKTQQCQ